VCHRPSPPARLYEHTRSGGNGIADIAAAESSRIREAGDKIYDQQSQPAMYPQAMTETLPVVKFNFVSGVAYCNTHSPSLPAGPRHPTHAPA
jgi:hypothetical protein